MKEKVQLKIFVNHTLECVENKITNQLNMKLLSNEGLDLESKKVETRKQG